MGATAVKTQKKQTGTVAKAPEPKGVVYVTQGELARGLTRVGHAIARNAGIAALSSVRVFTDSERVTLEVRGVGDVKRVEVELEGAYEGTVDRLISHAELKKTIAQFNKYETLGLRPLKAGLEVRSGQARCSLLEARREDWPEAPALDEGEVVVHAYGDQFGPHVADAATHASKDETRPILTGILLEARGEEQTLVATDSYRLALLDVPGLFKRDLELLVPAQALRHATQGFVAGSEEAVIVEDHDRHVVVLRDGERWTIGKLDGTYPNWRQLLPGHHELRVAVDTDRLLEAVRASARVLVKNVPLRIMIQKTQLKLSGSVPDGPVFNDTVSASCTPAPDGGTEVGINPNFFAAALAIMSPDKVEFDYISPRRPMLLTGEGERVLLMPIGLNA